MRRKWWVGALIVILVAVNSWFLYLNFRYAHTGIMIERSQADQWRIVRIEGDANGFDRVLEVGDVIEQIDNRNPGLHDTVKKWKVAGSLDTMVINRNGERFPVYAAKLRSGQDYLIQVGALICIATCAYLYVKFRSARSVRHLLNVFIVIGLIFMSLPASVRGDALGKLVLGGNMMLLPLVFYTFLHVFFREKGGVSIPKWFLKPLYGVAAIEVIGSLAYFTPYSYPFYYYSNVLIISFFSFVMGINLFIMTRLLIRHWKDRNSVGILIKSVWISLCASILPFVCLSFIPLLLLGRPLVSTLFSGCFLLLFPMSFTYLIATKQLYDIHIVVRRLFLTTAISLAPTLAIMGVISLAFSEIISVRLAAFLFLFILVLFSLILYSLEYMASRLERVIFPRKYGLQTALKKISKNLGTISSFRELKDIVLVDIVNALQVHGGAFAFLYKDEIETIAGGEIDSNEVEQLAQAGVLEHPSYLIRDVIANEEYTCYLFMTRKKSNTLLGREEVQWLNLIITYLSVTMENLFLIRKLTTKLEHMAGQLPGEQAAQDLAWFRKLMFELQEKERMRIATDIHDTTMQDLFFLKRRLSAILSRYAYEKEDEEQMTGLMEYVDVINANLRQSCFELYPHLLQEIGLLQTIQSLIEQENAACPFTILLNAVQAEGIALGNLETQRHLFRIVQELLNNARKHSHANQVLLELSATRDMFRLYYEDDGVGFDPEAKELQIGGSGIGMEQMRSRMLLLKGRMELETSNGNGVKIRMVLPIA